MSNDNTTHEFARLFDLPENHSLTTSDVSRVEKNRTVYETRWLEEHDNNQNLIARFRTWTNRSLQPPYRRQVGWEQYSLKGEVLDREIRYSKRDTMDFLH